MNDKMNPKETELETLLRASAEDANPHPAFVAKLEDQLKAKHTSQPRWSLPDARSLFAVIGWAGALAALALFMNWAIRNFALDLPQPAAGGTPSVQPTPQPFIAQVPTPEGQAYDRNGIQLYLPEPLPTMPAEAALHLVQPEQRATLADAQALAAQLGMDGAAYVVPSEIADSGNDFLIVDGGQRLYVRSSQYFTYYPDYARVINSFNPVPNPEAEQTIADFLAARGFTDPYRVEPTFVAGIYAAKPLTPEGYAIHYEYMSAASLAFQFDKDGLFSVSASLVKYAPPDGKTYRILSAEQAFQQWLDSASTIGSLEGQSGGSAPLQSWTRPRRENETLTVWGWMNSSSSAEGGAPLVSLDGYAAIGNVADFPEGQPNTFVEARGQFQIVDGAKIFNVEAWKIHEGYEDGIFGALQRAGENVVIVAENTTYILPDVPADVPIPAENMYVTGVKQGGVFEWKTLDDRPSFGGGGGGGGGYGFYKLNLSGVPVPFPTASATPLTDVEGGIPYVVVAGDTCASIAANFLVDVKDILAFNNMPADCSTLAVGQTLYIPYAEALPPQDVNLRGILSITIFESEDGSQRASYGFLTMGASDEFDTFYYYVLEGEGLEALQPYNSRPVDVWGKLGALDGIPTINVERFEFPFPDLQFQIMRGTEEIVELEGETAVLFTAENGDQFVELAPNCYNIIGSESFGGEAREGEPMMLETLAVPNLTRSGRAALCVFSSALAADPVTGEPIELSITADQPNIVPEMPQQGERPTLVIETVELVYYTPNQRYVPFDPARGRIYIQPAWRFFGHYSDGTIFEVLIQALDPIYLLPEYDEYTPPG